jgi:anti-sigma regulatory factor (Ser/Thr protein kinase)
MQDNINNIKTFKQEANIDNYDKLCSWIEKTRAEWNISKELANKIDICVEEVFANILHYAYSDKVGMFEVELKKTEDNIILEFQDEGVVFNPLDKPDPNLHLPPEKKALGGLGIYLTKKMSDDVVYKRENNKNILTIMFKA